MDEKYNKILTSRWAIDEQVHGCYIRLEDESPKDFPHLGNVGYFLSISKVIKPVAEQIVKEHNEAIGGKEK